MKSTIIACLLIALTPLVTQAQSQGMQILNVRNTFGQLGPTRADSKYLPGDVMYLAFNIAGLNVGEDGRAQYSSQLEVFDKSGKSIYKQEPSEKLDFVPLGGKQLPFQAYITIGVDQAPGEYTVRIRVEDKLSKNTESMTHKFEVLPVTFGIVQVYTTHDERGVMPSSTIGVIGENKFIFFAAVGFQRDDKKQPNLKFEMLMLDETGKPTLPKPMTHTVTAADEKVPTYPLRYGIPMTRPGNFTFRVTCEDKLAKKTVTFDLPVVVMAPTK